MRDLALRSDRQAQTSQHTGRRADIDGLRALAIGLVVVYHVWLGRVSGGVDVFLLISSYFLTGWFLRRSDALDLPALGSFWVRRFRRLVPAAAATIVAILMFVALALPASQWRSMWSQAWASLVYVQNRALSDAAVDYYARTELVPSPFQHFWSLSIQGQVFVLWPILIGFCIVTSRYLRVPVRALLTVVFSAIFIGSLSYAVWLVSLDPAVAYFSTPARLWEFALGSLAALLLPFVRPRRWVANILGWMGLVALVTCGVVLDVEGGFPGVAALWPTLAALAVIIAGQTDLPSSPSRLLSSRPMLSIGAIAYPLYLVHWPILIAYVVLVDTADVSFIGGCAVILASIAAAWASRRWVEKPRVAATSSLRGLRTIAVWAAVVAVPLAGWQLADRIRTANVDPTANPGAAVLMPWLSASVVDDAPLVPQGTAVEDEWVRLAQSCGPVIYSMSATLADSCRQTLTDDSAPTLLVLGDSHAQQWLGSMLPVLEGEQWNIIALLKGGCSLGPDEDGDDACVQWRDEAAEFATTYPADIVMMIGTKAATDSPEERVPRGLERVVDAIANSGSEVLLFRDNPRFSFDMYACLEAATRADPCAQPVDNHLAAENPSLAIAANPRVHVVDVTDYLCPAGMCPPAIGNVAVYLDDNHLGGTYARTLSPAVLAALQAIPGAPLG